MSKSNRRKQSAIFSAGALAGVFASTAVANADVVAEAIKRTAAKGRAMLEDDGSAHPLPQIGDDARVSSLSPSMGSSGHGSIGMDAAIGGDLTPPKTLIEPSATAQLPPPPAAEPAPKPASHVLVSSNSQASLEVQYLQAELDKAKAAAGGGTGGTEANGSAGTSVAPAPASETTVVSPAEPTSPPTDQTPVNQAPVIDADHSVTSINIARWGGTTATVGADFDDYDGDAMTYSVSGVPAELDVQVNPDGTLTVTRLTDFAGPLSFTQHADDGHGHVVDQTITINASNTAPTIGNTWFFGQHNAPTTGNIGITDAESAATASLVTGPTNGAVTLNANGSYTYTPDHGYSGADGFDVIVTDSEGAATTQTVVVNVAPNEAPTIGTTLVIIGHTETSVGNLGLTDADNSGGEAVVLKTAPLYGNVTVSADGTYTYVPDGDISHFIPGSPDLDGYLKDSFVVTATDSEGGTRDVAVNMWQFNNAPVVSGSDTIDVHYHDSATIDFSAFYTADPDGDTYSYWLDADGDINTIDAALPSMSWSGSTLNVTAGAGSWSGWTGMTDSTVNGYGVWLNLIQDNAAPTTTAPSTTITPHARTATVDLSTIFSDADGDALSYSNVQTGGTSASIIGDQLTITLDPNVMGGTVTITAQDGYGSSVAHDVIYSTSDNAPVALGGTIYVDLNSGSLDLNSGFTDADGDTLTYRLSFDGTATWLTDSDAMPAGVTWSGSSVTFEPWLADGTTIYVDADDGYGFTTSSTISLNHNIAPVFDAGAVSPVAITADDTPTILTTDQLVAQLGITDANDGGNQDLVFDNVSGGTIEQWGGDPNMWSIHSASAGAVTADVHVTDPYGAHLDLASLHIADAA